MLFIKYKISSFLYSTTFFSFMQLTPFLADFTYSSLCRLLQVNRSTYYKHFSAEPAPHIRENQHIASLILHICTDYNKQPGAYRIAYVFQRDYGIHISVGRVYRLIKQLQLPKMSTDKPSVPARCSDNETCTSCLRQNFNQKAPNLVWVSDITCIKADEKWYYLCIVMDLYSRKIIAWHTSANADVELVIPAFCAIVEVVNQQGKINLSTSRYHH